MAELSEGLEKELKTIIKKVIQETETQLAEEELKDIVKRLLPDLDELISNKIKQHFIEIGEFVTKKFKKEN